MTASTTVACRIFGAPSRKATGADPEGTEPELAGTVAEWQPITRVPSTSPIGTTGIRKCSLRAVVTALPPHVRTSAQAAATPPSAGVATARR